MFTSAFQPGLTKVGLPVTMVYAQIFPQGPQGSRLDHRAHPGINGIISMIAREYHFSLS
jgi:hypothetical protein